MVVTLSTKKQLEILTGLTKVFYTKEYEESELSIPGTRMPTAPWPQWQPENGENPADTFLLTLINKSLIIPSVPKWIHRMFLAGLESKKWSRLM